MNGIQSVAVHFIGADREDLACLCDVDQGRVIALEATIIVLRLCRDCWHSRRSQRLPVPGRQPGPTRQLAFRRALTQTDAWRMVRGRCGGRDRRADPLPHIPGDRHHGSKSRRGWAVSFSATHDSS